MRLDAELNQTRILQAARAAVADRGVNASMAFIADAAEVAIGTLYRHLPSWPRAQKRGSLPAHPPTTS
jgi:AcrR family transcriptional regulator